jgi:hypothetical protein
MNNNLDDLKSKSLNLKYININVIIILINQLDLALKERDNEKIKILLSKIILQLNTTGILKINYIIHKEISDRIKELKNYF